MACFGQTKQGHERDISRRSGYLETCKKSSANPPAATEVSEPASHLEKGDKMGGPTNQPTSITSHVFIQARWKILRDLKNRVQGPVGDDVDGNGEVI